MGFPKRVGNGKDTDIMSDPWVGNIPFAWWPTYIDIQKIQQFESVSELTCDKEWNNRFISEIFGSSLKERILNIHLSKHDENDKWIWARNEKGKLNSKVAYNFLKESEDIKINFNHNWKWLWNASVIPKAKVFAWKLLLGYKFELMDSWHNGKWLEEGMNLTKPCKEALIGSITTGLWHILRNRNDSCFKNKKASIKNLIWRSLSDTIVSKLPHECKIAKDHLNSSNMENSSNTGNDLQLSPSNHNKYYNIFFDAAWIDDKAAGFGFLFIDKEGMTILKGKSTGRIASPLLAET
ncbi:hypothetical protein Cni_G06758 [Canna indica]|uniref:Reverse transcriptase zinc-binding domain-containing protein n=1 Tax=Canna indica TaxID=4628 RepID=A0AAQ3Q6U9_9LILI|nr:hypothetical protein Cni_G06758 [Canna indica]